MILDTTFVIDVMNDDEEAIEVYREAEAAGQQQYLSSVTVLELYEGVARAIDSAAERERVRDVIDTRSVRSADRTVMAKAGRIGGELITGGYGNRPEGLYHRSDRAHRGATGNDA